MLIDKKKVQKAKEILGDRNATIMAEELGVHDFDEHNLRACCCFHQEDTPSLIYNSKNYTLHCFGCQKTVDIVDAFMINGLTYIEAVKKLFAIAEIPYSFGEVNVKTKSQYRYPKKVECENKDKTYEYLALRGISKETVDYADVCEDTHGNMAFNFYDTNDVLTMVKYRPARKINKKKGEQKCWCQKNADTTHLLFNMNKINANMPVLITEGEIDTLSAIEAGFINSCSVPLGAGNYGWIEENWDWLEQFETIIICADNDEAGLKLQKEAIFRLGSWRTKIVDIPHAITLGDDNIVQIKDLNEALYYCGKEYVLNLILNAKDSPVQSVQDLSDIKDIDLDVIDGIYTGIHDIDKELMKIFFGTLTIVSGTPGAGKTSFLYQLICQALDQSKNCWLYSKELPDWMTKNWLNYIFAGRRNVDEFQNENGSKYYKVTKNAKKDIDDYYRGRWFVYRDDFSSKTSDLIQSMTDVVRKYGVKLLILDNLMTIDMDANENNELQKQTETINQLIYFCTKYNVAVILVAHPRKLLNTTNVGIYDVSGSSNIVNLAHRTIGLRRVTNSEKKGKMKKNGKGWESEPIPFDVVFSVVKDRILGRANFVYGLYYDIPSRRFFSNESEFAHNYKWDKKVYTNKLEYPIKDEEVEVYGEIAKN